MKILPTTFAAFILVFSGQSIAQTINDDFTPYDEGATETSQTAENTSFIARKTSYDYLSFNYDQWESFDSDWTGLMLSGSYSILPLLSVNAGLSTNESDDFDGKGQRLFLGLDFHKTRSNQLDLIGSFMLSKYTYDSYDSFEYYLAAGARYFVNEKLDVSGGLRFEKITDDYDDSTTTVVVLGAKVRYFVSKTVEVGAYLDSYSVEYNIYDSQSFFEVGANARVYVTPKASIALSYNQADSRSDYSKLSLNARYDFKPIH